MAYEVVFKKRFINKLSNVLEFLETEWGKRVASEFVRIIDSRIRLLQSQPYIGSLTNIRNVRGLHITKHNRLYYKVIKNKIVIVNLYDTRKKSR